VAFPVLELRNDVRPIPPALLQKALLRIELHHERTCGSFCQSEHFDLALWESAFAFFKSLEQPPNFP